MNSPAPHRGEIWTTYEHGNPPKRRYVLVVSIDARNLNPRSESVLVVPFYSQLGPETGRTTVQLPPGETGLSQTSELRGHFISPIKKIMLREKLGRPLSDRRMRQVCLAIRRSFDPDAPASDAHNL
jgi:mRNA-degrading endonuclease toxin of MazEF toxin-antitoxin module